MKQVTVKKTDNYELISHGNGLAYELNNTAVKRSVFLQGDDALQFETELETWEKYHPYKATAEILGALFSQYESVSEVMRGF